MFDNSITLGISRVWTLGKQRRKGFASKVVDFIRSEQTVGKQKIAFSQPTKQGNAFALKYAGEGYLVYEL